MATLSLERLTKLFPGGRGVKGLDLAVDDGEIYGFIGPNGAGKSTTIRTVLGLMAPTSGRATILGHDTRDAGHRVRAAVGYLPSEPRLQPGLTVDEVLADLGGFFARDTRGRRRALAEVLDLDLSRAVDDLSLGNKKKVQLVAALQHAPRVVILDEPTNGLDPVVQARLFALLREERDRGATLFFSSHVLSEVERTCDRVGLLKDGVLVEDAPIAALHARSMKRVRARFADVTARGAARAPTLNGVSDVVVDDVRVTFAYRGAVPALLSALAADAPLDVLVEEPSLEEIVLAHYASASSPEVAHV